MLEALACNLGRNDEAPNIELAEQIVRLEDEKTIAELIKHVQGKDKAIANDCIKVLYEIGERRPELIRKYVGEFLTLLLSKNNRLVWGAMTALAQIADLESETLYGHLEMIKAAYENGSVITRDESITVFAKICSASSLYEATIFPILMDHLSHCRPKEVAQHAERMALCIHEGNKDTFVGNLRSRMDDLTEAQKKRVTQLIKKLK